MDMENSIEDKYKDFSYLEQSQKHYFLNSI